MELTVFISYSWDSESHKEWVLNLANQLLHNGVGVILDQYDLGAGKNMTHFMEVSIQKAPKVLLILTPNYNIKASGKLGGVGFEYSMISQNLFEIQDNSKFIPILRSGSIKQSAPPYIKSLLCHKMTDNDRFDSDFFELLRLIYDKPEIVKPKKGNPPDFDRIISDPILEKSLAIDNQIKTKNRIDAFERSKEAFQKTLETAFNLKEDLKNRCQSYKENTDLPFNIDSLNSHNEDQTLFSCDEFSIIFNWQVKSQNLDKPVLTITTWENYKTLGTGVRFEEPKRLSHENYYINYNDDLNYYWKSKENRIGTNKELINKYLSWLLAKYKRKEEKKNRL